MLSGFFARLDMNNRSGRNEDIEALRAIGIVFVLIAHTYKIFPWFKFDTGGLSNIYVYFGWWTGVDLFFCVSGFIISKSLLQQTPKDTSPTEFIRFSAPFWLKRIYRLWPASWFWLTFTVLCSLLLNHSGVFGKPINAIMYQVYAMLNMANIYGFECTKTTSCGVNQVYWSLSLEEQFYWILPFILFFIRGRKLAILLTAVALIQIPLDRGGQFIGFIRTDALAIGVLIGMACNQSWYAKLNPIALAKTPYSWMTTMILIGLLGLVGTWKIVVVPFNTGVVAIISGILVWIASYGNGYIIPGIRTLTNYLGSRSYSLYLAHIPAYYISYELMYRVNEHYNNAVYGNYLPYWILAIALAFIFAEFTHNVIETPLRNKGKRYSIELEKNI